MAIDPVCGMDVLPEEAAGTSRYKGADYYFCAVGCKEAFERSPERYMTEPCEVRGAECEVRGATDLASAPKVLDREDVRRSPAK